MTSKLSRYEAVAVAYDCGKSSRSTNQAISLAVSSVRTASATMELMGCTRRNSRWKAATIWALREVKRVSKKHMYFFQLSSFFILHLHWASQHSEPFRHGENAYCSIFQKHSTIPHATNLIIFCHVKDVQYKKCDQMMWSTVTKNRLVLSLEKHWDRTSRTMIRRIENQSRYEYAALPEQIKTELWTDTAKLGRCHFSELRYATGIPRHVS